MNAALAAAATGLIGVRFRLHGRDPDTGLDCVGVVAEAMRLAALTPVVPQGYRLRTLTMNDLEPFAQANGFETVGEADADVVLAMVSPVQLHLAINVPGGFVHAHAGIGRVTFLPGVLPWPVACSWRVPITMPTIRN
ncbi:hypothetical protein AQZ52_01365 [Novosphingobium fuchskuhlense]|uniref:NlpC/P60 domain-containing protein n=1 Tax=Novosphingobium fuchskuhlense TaxID=1117702 RepID=A0A117UZD8_9SPHN|nr:hypothetical protein [Novosphingobium fuchskuhlense]KUR73647.1 hypothetical protein AQZ52_01365 [Novosphingobium fuchskuhlense]